MGDVTAQGRSAANRQVAQGLPLRAGEQAAVLGLEVGAVRPDHVAHFQRRPIDDGSAHERPSVAAAGTTSRSRRLGGLCRRRADVQV